MLQKRINLRMVITFMMLAPLLIVSFSSKTAIAQEAEIEIDKQLCADFDTDTQTGTWSDSVEVAVGTEIYYRFIVSNVGDQKVYNIEVTDPTLGALLYSNSGYVFCTCELGKGGQYTSPAFGPVTAVSGIVYNTAYASGEDGEGASVSDEDTASYTTLAFNLTVDPMVAFNPVGTTHTINANIGFAVAGVDVMVKGPGVEESATTDENGNISVSYVNSSAGMDVINIWIDLDSDNIYDPDEPQVSQTKYWLENYVTGGGNVKDGKKVKYTFGGTVGVDETEGIVGNFQIADHTGKGTETWHIHTGDFEGLTFLGDPTGSPEASHHRAYFSGTFTSNRGNSAFLSLMLFDNDEPGAGYDYIAVRYWDESDWSLWFDGDISGGNIQVHDIP